MRFCRWRIFLSLRLSETLLSVQLLQYTGTHLNNSSINSRNTFTIYSVGLNLAQDLVFLSFLALEKAHLDD